MALKNMGGKINSLNALEDTGVPFHLNFNSILIRDHQKYFQ